jgi:hypothetical protein
MGGMFSKPKAPKAAANPNSAAAKRQQEREASAALIADQRKRSKYGRQSTILGGEDEKPTALGS